VGRGVLPNNRAMRRIRNSVRPRPAAESREYKGKPWHHGFITWSLAVGGMQAAAQLWATLPPCQLQAPTGGGRHPASFGNAPPKGIQPAWAWSGTHEWIRAHM